MVLPVVTDTVIIGWVTEVVDAVVVVLVLVVDVEVDVIEEVVVVEVVVEEVVVEVVVVVVGVVVVVVVVVEVVVVLVEEVVVVLEVDGAGVCVEKSAVVRVVLGLDVDKVTMPVVEDEVEISEVKFKAAREVVLIVPGASVVDVSGFMQSWERKTKLDIWVLDLHFPTFISLRF